MAGAVTTEPFQYTNKVFHLYINAIYGFGHDFTIISLKQGITMVTRTESDLTALGSPIYPQE